MRLSQSTMWTDLTVLLSSALHKHLGLLQGVEDLPVGSASRRRELWEICHRPKGLTAGIHGCPYSTGPGYKQGRSTRDTSVPALLHPVFIRRACLIYMNHLDIASMSSSEEEISDILHLVRRDFSDATMKKWVSLDRKLVYISIMSAFR